jgi:EmrB/QacA subfamily drug resistance transporter
MLALFLGALDQTIVSTALPGIVSDLRGLDRYAWVATAYLLASTSLVPVYGKLADMYSRKAIEIGAVTVFLTGSCLCGLAGEFGSMPIVGDGMNQLIVARGIQGLGAAGLVAMTFLIIADLFPPAERGKYQGLMGATFATSSVLGPLIGGVLSDHAGGLIPGVEGWRWVFYVNLPLGLLALWFIITHMPPLRPAGTAAKLDLGSAALFLLGIVPFVFALQLPAVSQGAGESETTTVVLLLLVAVIAFVLWIYRSLRVEHPLLDLALFKNPVFTRANVAGFFSGGAFLSIIIFLPLFITEVVGVSATRTGISLIPFSLGIAVGATTAGQVASRTGHYRSILLTGGALLFLGVFLLSRMDASVSYVAVTAYMTLCGIGLGPTFPLFTLVVQNSVDPSRLGQATSAAQFFRQIGATVGGAAIGTVLATAVGPRLLATRELSGIANGASDEFIAALTTGTTRICAYVLGFVAISWIVTFSLPEREIRSAHHGIRDRPGAVTDL